MTSTTGRNTKYLESKSGFTLIELVLVLLIITVMLAIAAPNLRGFLKGRKSVNAAAQVVALGQFARAQAIGTGTVYRLNVDAAAKAYWLTAQKGAEFAALGTEFGRRFNLPEGTVATWKAQTQSPLGNPVKPLDTGAGHDYVDFFPDGRTEATTLVLTDSSGRVFEIGCLSETELFMLQDGKNR